MTHTDYNTSVIRVQVIAVDLISWNVEFTKYCIPFTFMFGLEDVVCIKVFSSCSLFVRLSTLVYISIKFLLSEELATVASA